MSDTNGDGSPLPNLRNAMRVLAGEVHRMQKVARRRRRQGFQKGPRQYCGVCGKTFDFAIVDPEAPVAKTLCTPCKETLAEGYVAVITADHYAFLKSDYFKEHGMAGKVIPVSVECFNKLKERFDSERPKTDAPE